MSVNQRLRAFLRKYKFLSQSPCDISFFFLSEVYLFIFRYIEKVHMLASERGRERERERENSKQVPHC